MITYGGLIGQLGTDDPMSTIVINQLYALPVWTRREAGKYDCKLDKAFVGNVVFPMNGIRKKSSVTGEFFTFVFDVNDEDSFMLATVDDNGNYVDECLIYDYFYILIEEILS